MTFSVDVNEGYEYRRSLQEIQASLTKARQDKQLSLDEPSAKRLLTHFSIAVPRATFLADSVSTDEIEVALADLRPPYVLKVVSPDILHKSDSGGVKLGLTCAQALRQAMDDMRLRVQQAGHCLEGFLIEETVPSGHDLAIGGFNDTSFGPVLMVGLGGIFVELLQDVAFRICPITPLDAQEMLNELKAAPVLRGARGGLAVSTELIIQTLLSIGGTEGLLMQLMDSVAELDINPLMVSASGAVAADARIVLHPLPNAGQTTLGHITATKQTVTANTLDVVNHFVPLFEPRSIAVIGVSSKGVGQGNSYINCLRQAGYTGAIYPIHPTESLLEGLPTYSSLADTPQTIDYAFVAIAAAGVPSVLEQANGRVRYAQVMSAGFDQDEHGQDLKQSLLRSAQAGGMRLLGPNCMGTHSPRGRVSFIDEGVDQAGSIGIMSQSGGLSIDILRRGRHRGLQFSGLVSMGNCLDVGPCDLLAYYLADPNTRVIGAYLENITDGRLFFTLLRQARGLKPVVILKGGRSVQGQRAAASHTGSLASKDQVWRALAKQTGSLLVDNLAQFIDTLVAFQASTNLRVTKPQIVRESSVTTPPESHTNQVVLFGNGGGASVLAADTLARYGLNVGPLKSATIAALEALKVPAGASLDNPIDVPANVLQRESGALALRILQTICSYEIPNAIIMHLNLPVILGYRHVNMLDDLVRAAIALRAALPISTPLLLVLRSSGQLTYENARQACTAQAMQAGIPVFIDLPEAAQALHALDEHTTFLRSRAVVTLIK